MEEGPRELAADWWGAILQKGSMVLGHDDKVEDDQGKVRETHTRIDATMKGVTRRYRSTTQTVTEQLTEPSGTPIMMMVYNKASGLMVSPTL